jgi:hypothetical protein
MYRLGLVYVGQRGVQVFEVLGATHGALYPGLRC